VAFVQSASNASGGSSASVTPSSAPTSGNVAVITINSNGSSTTHTDNNGSTPFTKETDEQGNGTHSIATFYRVLGGSEPATYNFDLSSSQNKSIIYQEFSLIDTSDVWDVPPSATTSDEGTGTTATAPSMTTSNDGAMGVIFAAVDSSGVTFSAPTNSYTNLISEPDNRSSACASRVFATAGATGTTALTLGSDDWIIHQFALKPAAVTGGDIAVLRRRINGR